MTINRARNVLAIAWGAGSLPLLILVSIQTYNDMYGVGEDSDKGLLWIFPLVLPVFGMIVGAMSVSQTQVDNLTLSSVNFFWLTLLLIVVYFVILYSAMLIGLHNLSPSSTSRDWTNIISKSSWILGTLQWVITIALTKFFIENIRPESAPKRSSRRSE